MNKVITIGRITFLEAVRDRFFNFVFILSFLMLATGSFFLRFDFGSTDVDFLFSFSIGTLSFFGLLISIILVVHLWFSEIQNRTILTILARPVSRLEYLLGKWMGCFFLVVSFTFLLGMISFVSIVFWNFIVRGFGLDALNFLFIPYLTQLLALSLKLLVITSIVLMVSVIGSSSLFSTLVSFVLLLICMFQFVARDSFLEMAFFPFGWFSGLVSIIIPSYQVLDYNFMRIFGEENWNQKFLYFLGYSILYIIGYLTAALLIFRKKQVIQQ